MNNVENLQKIEKAADQGITTKDIQESKDVIADDAARKQFVDYCKDAKNNINMKECLLPSLQNIINDPTADKETKALASKLHRALVGNRIMRDIDPNQAQYKNVIMSKDSKGEWILKKIDENKKLVDIDPVKDAELRNQYYRKDDKGEITMIYKDTERFMLHSPRLNSDPKLIER